MDNNVGFIGAGNMAFAIVSGMLRQQYLQAESAFVYDINEDSLKRFSPLGVHSCKDMREIVQNCRYIFLSVKPQNFTEVLSELRGVITDRHVLVSIAAGISGDYIKKAIGFDCKLVRAMPNTPLLLGCGAVAVCKIDPVTQAEFDFVKGIFASSGLVKEISQDKMNEVIGINGSTPAFIYQYAQYYIQCAVENGIEEKTATELFAATLVGSARMITDSGFDIQTLIQMVSSKGGTTIAGLEALERNGLENAVRESVDACVRRAYELEK